VCVLSLVEAACVCGAIDGVCLCVWCHWFRSLVSMVSLMEAARVCVVPLI
jgi:hypothetical protein